MNLVEVYTGEHCNQCDATIRKLNKEGIPFVEVKLSQQPDALDFVRSLGYQQVPVVYRDQDTHWSGFRPDNIAALAA